MKKALIFISAKFPAISLLALLVLLAPSWAYSEETLSFRVHLVNQGDTLRSIAAEPDRYGNPHLWTLIYGINRKEIAKLGIPPAEIPMAPLPEGTVLAILTARPADAEKYKDYSWVLNLVSSKTEADLYEPAVVMIDRDHLAYIVPAQGQTTDWLRLRVGFFADREAAKKAGKRIVAETDIKDFWVTTEEDGTISSLLPFLSPFHSFRLMRDAGTQ